LSGDTDAFGTLVEKYHGLVGGLCRACLRDEHEALDAAQDAFVQAYLKLRELRDPRRLGGWLRRIAFSVCMNRLEKRKRGACISADDSPAVATDNGPGPAETAAARELAEAVLRSIARLPEKYRKPIEMFYMEGASTADIAGRLGLGAGTVRTRLLRGRQMLRPELARFWPVEVLSRNKQLRRWLPCKLQPKETAEMKLEYEKRTARLLRGEAEVTIRPMNRQDIPALRRFSDEADAAIEELNAQSPPGGSWSCPGGPWSNDEWLLEHFEKYQRHGGMTLLAEDAGRIVGFADLWPTEEPEPFGRSLNVECIDYFREYFLAGLETILLAEAEKVAREAGLPALDIGTNTCSGEYTSLRRFGLKVFYEYDHVLCRCKPTTGTTTEKALLAPETAKLGGLIKASHWCPTDFTFRAFQDEPTYLAELRWPDRRAVVELWRFNPEKLENLPVPEYPPDKCELFVQPEALESSAAMSEILTQCGALAGELGAEQIELPCPSEIELDREKLEVLDRRFAFAWLRKRF